MISVGGVTLLGGAGIGSIGGIGSRTSRSRVSLLGGVKNNAEPAALLGGANQNFAQGLYSSLGQLVGGSAGAFTDPTAVSPADKERQVALESISSKIDGGQIAEGRAEAETLLKKNANDITAIRLVAVSYLVERNYKQAEKFYLRALSLAPGDSRLTSDLENVQTLQKDDGQVLDEARRRLNNPDTRDAALRLLMNLSARSPSNADAYVEMARGFSANREPAKVVGALQEALRYGGADQIDAIVSEAKKLAEQFPKVGMTHNIYGRALQKVGRLDDAIVELQRAVDIAPDNFGYNDSLAGAYAARALESLASGNRVSAASDFRMAMDANPLSSSLGEVEARLAAEQAQRQMNGGRYTAALGELYTAASKAPDDEAFTRKVADLYIRVGIHFEGQDQNAQALSAYKKAFELNPKSTIARRHAAELSYAEGIDARDSKSYDVAIDHLQYAYDTLRVNANYGIDLAETYNLRGQQQLSIGNLDEAIADFTKGFSIDPTNSSLDANLSAALIQKNNS